MPLINQVPASEPMSKSMMIAGVVEAILLLTPFKIFIQEVPLFNPIMAAKAADSKSAN
mgnify:CR=1 FL=1